MKLFIIIFTIITVIAISCSILKLYGEFKNFTIDEFEVDDGMDGWNENYVK